MKYQNNDFIPEKTSINLETIDVKIFKVANSKELIKNYNNQSSELEAVKNKNAPYWSELWNASIVLSKFLAQHNIIQKPSMKVTEIGCGLGLAGITAGILGAEVIFTDYDPIPLEFTEKSWNLNLNRPAQFEIMDWNQPNLDFKADLILAADCAYGPNFEKLLLNVFDNLCSKKGMIILADPMRSLSNQFYLDFEKNPQYETEYFKVVQRFLDEGPERYQTIRITKLIKRS